MNALDTSARTLQASEHAACRAAVRYWLHGGWRLATCETPTRLRCSWCRGAYCSSHLSAHKGVCEVKP